jgi:hypothetical protein
VAENFGHIHTILCYTINEWAQDSHSSQHLFYAEWQKYQSLGLTTTLTFKKIEQILKNKNYEDYINIMNQCPLVTEYYLLECNASKNQISYKLKINQN